MSGNFRQMLFIILVKIKWNVYYFAKMDQVFSFKKKLNTGKIREFSQSGRVGTMRFFGREVVVWNFNPKMICIAKLVASAAKGQTRLCSTKVILSCNNFYLSCCEVSFLSVFSNNHFKMWYRSYFVKVQLKCRPNVITVRLNVHSAKHFTTILDKWSI